MAHGGLYVLNVCQVPSLLGDWLLPYYNVQFWGDHGCGTRLIKVSFNLQHWK